MGWTTPRLLVKGNEWYDDEFDYEGPACYELGTGGPRGGKIQWHYVGETANEKKRVSEYARSGSHLSSTIDWHLRRGWSLYYRAFACSSKKAAKEMQDRMLGRLKYDWNKISNLD
jgi:hypothetical protein